MKRIKFWNPKTETDRKFVPHLCMLGAGFCGGIFVHFGTQLIDAVFARSWYVAVPNVVGSGSMSIVILVVMALCLHRWSRQPNVQELLQQARNEKKVEKIAEENQL